MNYSKQKELIEKVVKSHKNHPTADDIFFALRKELPNLSLATVYRNLRALTNNGQIKTIAFPNSKDRFDGNISEHFHVQCEECGKIYDIELDIIEELDKKITLQTGVIPKKHQIIISGLCANCNAQVRQ